MSTRYWNPNAQSITQVDTFTVTAIALGGTIAITCNGKSVTYTGTATDTLTTAAAGLLALLTSTTNPAAPAEFADATYSQSGAVITATATTQGTPFTFGVASAGGATLTQTHTTLNSSPSDVDNASNWLDSGGLTGLPVNGDDVIIADSSVSLLWNLSSLSAVSLNSLTVWMSFTGNIGLPEINPAGYIEYRPTYWQIGITTVVVGTGSVGSGSGLMRFNVGAVASTWDIINTGTAGTGTDFALRILGTNATNVLKMTNGSVAIAMLPAETSNFNGGITVNGGSIALGFGLDLTGNTLTVNNGGSAEVRCRVEFIATDGGSLTFFTPVASPVTYTTITLHNGSNVTWNGPGGITALSMYEGSTFSKQDPSSLTVVNATLSSDSQVQDPYSGIAWTNGATIVGPILNGPITAGPGKNLKIT